MSTVLADHSDIIIEAIPGNSNFRTGFYWLKDLPEIQIEIYDGQKKRPNTKMF